MFLFSADSGARPVPSELVLWCVVAFTKERSAWSSRTKMLNQSDWIISNCTSSLLLRELLLVPIGCSTLARLAAVHPSSAQPPPSPSLGPRSSATRSRKGLVLAKCWPNFFGIFPKCIYVLRTSIRSPECANVPDAPVGIGKNWERYGEVTSGSLARTTD